MLYERPKTVEIKAGVSQLTDGFGWYLTLKQLAESGIFNLPNETPMRSAELANLYEAFTYLASVAAERKYQERLLKEQQKQ